MDGELHLSPMHERLQWEREVLGREEPPPFGYWIDESPLGMILFLRPQERITPVGFRNRPDSCPLEEMGQSFILWFIEDSAARANLYQG